MREISLTKDAVALVDDGDFETLTRFKWHLSSAGYAVRSEGVRKVFMHRAILGITSKDYVDHADGNPLNNTRANLRVATNSQNQATRKGVRGITLHRGGKWQAQIKVRGKSIYLGLFGSVEDAQAAYRRAAIEHFGEFARTGAA
jgi:hypothetical protein